MEAGFDSSFRDKGVDLDSRFWQRETACESTCLLLPSSVEFRSEGECFSFLSIGFKKFSLFVFDTLCKKVLNPGAMGISLSRLRCGKTGCENGKHLCGNFSKKRIIPYIYFYVEFAKLDFIVLCK